MIRQALLTVPNSLAISNKIILLRAIFSLEVISVLLSVIGEVGNLIHTPGRDGMTTSF